MYFFCCRNNHCPEVQQSVLKQQLALAVELNKPLVIHCRDAQDDALQILIKVLICTITLINNECMFLLHLFYQYSQHFDNSKHYAIARFVK